MSINQTLTTSFKLELLNAVHAFGSIYRPVDTFMIALYAPPAVLSATTTVYSTINEISGTGYTAGGQALTIVTPITSGTTAFLTFQNVIWTSAPSLMANGALIYNASQGNRSVCVLAFGQIISSQNNTFTIQMPTLNVATALIGIA